MRYFFVGKFEKYSDFFDLLNNTAVVVSIKPPTKNWEIFCDKVYGRRMSELEFKEGKHTVGVTHSSDHTRFYFASVVYGKASNVRKSKLFEVKESDVIPLSQIKETPESIEKYFLTNPIPNSKNPPTTLSRNAMVIHSKILKIFPMRKNGLLAKKISVTVDWKVRKCDLSPVIFLGLINDIELGIIYFRHGKQ